MKILPLLIASLLLPVVLRAENPAPTLTNIAYGEDARQVLDFYKAPASPAKPTPLVFHIHGGGWVNGDKRNVDDLARYLAAGISVVSINYRYTTQAQEAGVMPPVEWPMHDAARALQFVRSKAAEWHIDKTRIGATGGSAGACTSLWLALHDDMADAKSNDSIARESTRLWCAAVNNAQTSLDPQQMQEWTPNSRYGGHAFGFMDPKDKKTRDTRFAEFLACREGVLRWIKEYSPIEHVSAGDPPVYLNYRTAPALGESQKDPTHTSNFGVKLREKLNSAGVPCELVYPGASGIAHADSAAFLIDMLKTTPLRIAIIGDSTVCNYPMTRPDRGWGMFIEEQFELGSVKVINTAAGGRSTKTFIKEGRWEKTLAQKPDYVLIQFGHNDSHAPEKPESTNAETDYKDYLRRYIGEARAIGAAPILVTPMVRRLFDESGKKLKNELQRYADAMKAVGEEKNVPVIDLHSASKKLVEQLGPEKSAEFANKKGDGTHFNEKGARAMAAIVMAELPAAAPKLKAYLKSKNDGGYLFVTFRDEQGALGEQIYFALSKDGIRWTALNDGKPALISELGEKGARDPYLLRAENGKFFLIATDLSIFHTRNWKRAVQEGSRSLLIWESDDLVNWQAPRLVPVAPPDAGCTWAPEAIYDNASQRYLVYWASTTKGDNFEKHRIWAAWTTDFRAFSPPFIYIEKPTTIIDTDIVRGDDGKFHRFTKDEKHKAISMETSDGGVTGVWHDVAGFTLAQLRGYEGPACYQLTPAKDGKPATWCLLLDAYAMRGGYKPFVTDNLASGDFTPGADFEFPFRFRHGSVLPISEDEYRRLQSAYSK